MKHLSHIGFCLVLMLVVREARATTYYVSPSGSDSAAGTQAAPFLTISHAAAIMAPGDTCLLRAGTYRETVRPNNSGTNGAPIIFSAYSGEKAEVTGNTLLPTSGWTAYAGSTNIYQLSYATNITDLFLGGQHVSRARYPAESTLPYDTFAWMPLTVQMTTNYASTVLFPTNVTFPAHTWDGATVVAMPDYPAWVAYCGTVVTNASTTSVLATNLSQEWKYWQPGTNNPVAPFHGYFTDTVKALTVPGQWYYQSNTGTLYVWAPNGASPAAQGVEGRTRNYAFDLNGRNYIQVIGIDVRAAKLNLRDAQHCLLQNCSVRYVTPFQRFNYGFNRDINNNGTAMATNWEYTGVEVSGTNNMVSNCYISESYGDGLSVWGMNNTVQNCLVENTDRSFTDAANINLDGTGHQIVTNTFRTTGRAVLVHRTLKGGGIGYNDMSEGGFGTSDLGITYSFGNDLGSSRIFYNWIHDNVGTGVSGKCAGIYLDSRSLNIYLDHNVIWNCGTLGAAAGIFVNSDDTGVRVYNNTVWDCPVAVQAVGTSTSTNGVYILPYGDAVLNNLAPYGPFMGDNVANNQLYNPDFSPFVDPVNFNFQLLAGSAPVGGGQPITGITDTTPADVGAYDLGATWTAGTALTPPAFADLRPSNPDRLAAVQPGWAPEVRLSWRDRSSNETGYQVYRRAEGEDNPYLNLIATLPAGSTQYTDTNAAYSTIYNYQVVATNTAGRSAGSVPSSVFTVSDGSAARLAAVDFDAMSGIGVMGNYIGSCDNGDWIKFSQVDLRAGYTTLQAYLSYNSTLSGRGFEIRIDSTTGTRLGTFVSTNTASWTHFQVQPSTPLALLAPTSGVHDLYFMFLGGSGVGNFQWFQLGGGRAVGGPVTQTASVRAASAMTGGSIGAGGYSAGNTNTITFKNVDLGLGSQSISLDLAAAASGESVDVHADSAAGALLGTVNTTNTGSLTAFLPSAAALSSQAGFHDLCLVFHGAAQNFRSYALTVLSPPQGPYSTAISGAAYNSMSGITNAGTYVGGFDGGDWVCYNNVNFGINSATITFSLATMTTPPVPIEAHLDSLTGPLVGIIRPAATASWTAFQNQTMSLCGVGGTHNLYLSCPAGAGYGAANIASFTINSQRGGTLQAVSYSTQSGITNAGTYIGALDGGDWVCYPAVWFGANTTTATLSLAVDAAHAGQTLELHLDSAAGPLVGTLHPASTGSWSTFVPQAVTLSGASGLRDLYLVVPSPASGAANVASFTFN